MASPLEDMLDALIVGAGFSGIYLLHRLRSLGYRVKAIDANASLGGVWRQNIYPGARVDIEVPTYELRVDELCDDNSEPWIWSERFPSGEELQKYFDWLDAHLKITKDCEFNTWVHSAVWNDHDGYWQINGSHGRIWKATFFIPCLGYAARPYVPDFKGLETFKGKYTHSAKWPKEGLVLDNKRVGIIGTGASAVQIIQSIAGDVQHLVCSSTINYSVLTVTNMSV
jgi:cation diffusion facilitator CzcD-associated flavoprotein CzcO